jgi:hypothetical protein
MGDAMATLITCGVRLADMVGQDVLGSIDVLLIASRRFRSGASPEGASAAAAVPVA